MRTITLVMLLLFLAGCSSGGSTNRTDGGVDGGTDGGGDDGYDSPCAQLPGIVEEVLPQEGSSNSAWHWVGDVNGDSYGDWLVNVEDSENAASGLILGYSGLNVDTVIMDATTVAQLEIVADVMFEGVGLFASNFRPPSGMAGDVDGDGLWDILFGRPAILDSTKTPEVFLVYGRTDGWEGNLNIEDIGVRFVGETGTNFGWATQGGDIDGDGYADIAITDPGTDTKPGSLNVFYGSETRFQSDVNASDADWVIEGAPGLRAMRMEGFWFYNDYPNDFVFLPEVLDQQFLTDAADATTISPVECGICNDDGEKEEEYRLLTEGPRKTGTTSLQDLELFHY